MIDALQNILGRMFDDEFASELMLSGTRPPEEKPVIAFELPEQMPARPRLSVNLVDMRENRKLRTSSRMTHGTGPERHESRVPLHLDCHFIATSWVKVDQPANDVKLESSILYHAAAALMRNNPLIPRDIYAATENGDLEPGEPRFDALPENHKAFLKEVDPVLRDRKLPINPLPPEGFSKLAEFFGLIGVKSPTWRPAIYFVVTLPVEQKRKPSGPIVKAIDTRVVNRSASRFDPRTPEQFLTDRESFVSIDGSVLNADGHPVANHPVELEFKLEGSPAHVKQSHTDQEGHYRFVFLPGQLKSSRKCTWEIRAVDATPLTGTGPLVPRHSYDIQLTN